MRFARERPRVFLVVGWMALVLVLLGALIGATASSREGDGEREALEAARLAALEARAEADRARAEVGELARALKGERRHVAALRQELRSARRDARQKRNRR